VATIKPNVDGWSLVMAGHWNRKIFTPAWIIDRLTTSKDVGIEVPVENPSLPIRFSFDGIKLCVNSAQLVLAVDRPEDGLLKICGAVAVKILTELPHTPLRGVGLNYQFAADLPDAAVLKVFNLSDNNTLSDAEFKIRATVIQRKILIGDQTVNLSLTLAEDNKVQIFFNFHKNTPSTKEAIDFLSVHSTDLKQKAFEILSKIYGLNVE
jgi:hypothetical protein